MSVGWRSASVRAPACRGGDPGCSAGSPPGRPPGTGLGLFVVREPVRSQGGGAAYDVGPGSPAGEFVIHLPGASVPRVTAARCCARCCWSTTWSTSVGWFVPRCASEAASRSWRRAGDGAEAVRLAGETHPDLVVLDLGLPDIAGRDVLGRIREVSPASKVVFSGLETRTGWITQQVDGYVVKDAEARLSRRPAGVGRPAGWCRGTAGPARSPDHIGPCPAVRGADGEGVGAERSSTTLSWSAASSSPMR